MKKVTLVTTLTLSLAFLATSNVKANETTITSEPTTTVTTTQATTSVESTSESPVTTTEASVEQPSTSTSETTSPNTNVTKSGTEITVTHPKVTVDQSDGAGKYNAFKVKYENITIPDEIPVNAGDKVVLTLPKEVKFQTSFDFDVKNPTQDVVGKAYADSESGKLTTIFNNYFHTHPVNKQMSLTFDARWTDDVESGKPVSANFDGTIVTTNIAKEQEIGKDELVAKWGSQDKDDPTVINWTVRVNYARRILNVVKLLDTMSDNQKLVDDYLKLEYVDSVEPWVYAGDAKELVKSMVKTENGFELTLNRLERMVYVNYKTKLTKPVKDSVNPTNKITLTSDDITASSTIGVSLVGGRGDAVGENKPEPKWELPNEAPIVEIPELNINDVPLLPPPPVVEIPELPLEDIPLLPPAPILEKPELKITEEPKETPTDSSNKKENPNKPSIPKETPTKSSTIEKHNKPKENTPVPNTSVTPVSTTSVSHYVSQEQDSEEQISEQKPMLPNTGESSSVLLFIIGLTVLSASVFTLLRKN